MNKRTEYRNSLFKEIKELYESKIVSYDMSLRNLDDYMKAYYKINCLIGGLNTDKLEIKIRLGDAFDMWFFKTHHTIVKMFWKNFKF